MSLFYLNLEDHIIKMVDAMITMNKEPIDDGLYLLLELLHLHRLLVENQFQLLVLFFSKDAILHLKF
jgi:hypothetical protein